MKRLLKLGIKAILVSAVLIVLLAGAALADDSSGPMGPAPNSGDGVPDGSGFEGTNGPNGTIGSGSGPIGPAPNSGDGIPDGSGF
ncbi:hypothetical protein ACFLWU_05470 [Chloroflexota bacterium]